MKLTSLLKITAISLTACLASCGDKKDKHSDHDHDHEHKGSDHSSHDHEKKDSDHDHEHKDSEKKDSDHDHSHDEKDKSSEHAEHGHTSVGADHSKCGVVVGPKGGRMIDEIAELNLTEEGKISLTFQAKPAEGTKVTILKDGAPIALTQVGNTYTSAAVGTLPTELHVSIKDPAGKKIVEKFTLEMGECTKCGNAKLACTCHNHAH